MDTTQNTPAKDQAELADQIMRASHEPPKPLRPGQKRKVLCNDQYKPHTIFERRPLFNRWSKRGANPMEKNWAERGNGAAQRRLKQMGKT